MARKNVSVALLIGLFAALAMVMLMPLGFAAQNLGFSARTSQGTIMSGALRDASIGRVRIGDVNARLRLLPLLTGGISFALQRGNAPQAPGISGAIGRGLGGYFADELSATFATDGLIQGLDGIQLQVEKFSFMMDGDRCVRASGTVRLLMDEAALGSIIRGDMLGDATCRSGDLVLPLMSPSTMERATLRFKPDGRYSLTVTVTDSTPELANALSSAGFQPIAGGYRLIRSGSVQ